MENTALDADLLSLLKSVDTPTVCNAIEVAQGKRGFQDFTRKTVIAADPTLGPIVGFARTARISAVAPPTEPPEVIKQRRMAYYRYMASGDGPTIAVVEDADDPHCVGAFWGEVNTTIHVGLGVSGVLTNGVLRDLGDLAPNFQVLAGSIGPSHGFVHVRDINEPVNVFGLRVHPGDLLHADRHGAVVIPREVISSLKNAIAKLHASEKLILEPARQPGFTIERFEEAWRAFEAART
ncbi:RraA family protein [Ensifer adhaerens]|uniref:RraA family protein n=1 Tax=Ensifer adhaerens TaxID=106592 RepID=UPI001C4E1348|nr:RraA family protein [Ensifer adhaerens]MBW0370869.1 RraA family protein [Ensifer adhaerens]UCM24368.1 RraA family protein [Ensifer adhaerens]